MFNDSLFVVFGSSFVPFDIAKIRWFLVSFQLFSCFSSQKHATISPFYDKSPHRPQNLSQRIGKRMCFVDYRFRRVWLVRSK